MTAISAFGPLALPGQDTPVVARRRGVLDLDAMHSVREKPRTIPDEKDVVGGRARPR